MTTWACGACGASPDHLLGACPACREPRPVERGWAAGLEEACRVGTLLATWSTP